MLAYVHVLHETQVDGRRGYFLKLHSHVRYHSVRNGGSICTRQFVPSAFLHAQESSVGQNV